MPKQFTLALDKSTARTLDVDGRLRVSASNITKACVNPYFGKEIPGWDTLGLDPARIYNLLRDPAELAKAAPTFTNVPLLIVHKGTTADNHDKQVVVGAVGEAEWAAPYVRASLCVWTEEAIAGIESKAQTELSCGYRYRPDMTPGTYEGMKYDGVMRDIIGNHVALVEVGRAGSDVVVADSNPFLKGIMMKYKTPQALVVAGALRTYLVPKLAQDAQIGNLSALLADVKAATFVKSHPALAEKVKKHFAGKLAQDANLDDLQSVLAPLALDAESDDDMKAKDGVDEEEDEERAADEPGTGNGEGNTEGGPKANTKQAMDAAAVQRVIDAGIKAGLSKIAADMDALHEARNSVAPLVGAVALDSAESVYKFALDHAKVQTEGVHPSAYRALFQMHMATTTAAAKATPRMATDSAAVKSADQRFADLGRFAKL